MNFLYVGHDAAWDYVGASFNIAPGVYSKMRLVFPVLSVMSLCKTSRAKQKNLRVSKPMERVNGVRESKRVREQNKARAIATLQCAKTKMGKRAETKAGTNRARSWGSETSRVVGRDSQEKMCQQ